MLYLSPPSLSLLPLSLLLPPSLPLFSLPRSLPPSLPLFSLPPSLTPPLPHSLQVMQLGKLLTSCLFTLFSEASLAEQASRDSLIEVEQDIIGYLVDERLLKLEEAPQFIRSFNCLMLRVCENTNKTAIFW